MKNLLILALGIVTLEACGPSLKVSTDYDHRVDFTRYKTYGLSSAAKSNISSLNQERILNSVRNEMGGKGFTENKDQPDLLVNVSVIVKNNVEVNANTNYYGYGGMVRPYYWGDGMVSSNTTYDVQHYKSGSLIIDMADASTKKLVWEGTGNSKIDQPTEDADKRIAGAVNKIMENFPPK
ncbi:MAG TPA: DUF4136 domain-containing protein [Puia sp.]|jgi:hypothetical protein